MVKESLPNARLTINRINGADGEISVTWVTNAMTARDGIDYIGGSGTLTFAHGETSKDMDIQLLGKVRFLNFSFI